MRQMLISCKDSTAAELLLSDLATERWKGVKLPGKKLGDSGFIVVEFPSEITDDDITTMSRREGVIEAGMYREPRITVHTPEEIREHIFADCLL
jgi:hypothetical protein